MNGLSKALAVVNLSIEIPFLLGNNILMVDCVGDLYYLDINKEAWVFCQDLTLGILLAYHSQNIRQIPCID